MECSRDVIEYGMKKGIGDQYSRLQISRNYMNAIPKIGGTAFKNDLKRPDGMYMKITKDGKEIRVGFFQGYAGLAGKLVIVEKQARNRKSQLMPSSWPMVFTQPVMGRITAFISVQSG